MKRTIDKYAARAIDYAPPQQAERYRNAIQEELDFIEQVRSGAYEKTSGGGRKSGCYAVSVPRIAPTGGKKQYKTVAGPVGVIVSGKDSYGSGVKQYAAIIDREAVGGWKLESIYEIPVTKKAGCLASLLGKHDETVFFNMLIFSKVE